MQFSIPRALIVAALPVQDGAAIDQRSCAPCHEAGADRAPTHQALRAMSPEGVLAAMESPRACSS
jgi:hypothetical protein